MKVLITGFEPFGKETTNPSYEAVRLLPDEINGAKIVKAEIPVVFRKGGEEVQKLVRQENPDIVILVGQSGGRSAVTVERIAINCEDCPSGFPDSLSSAPRCALRLPASAGSAAPRSATTACCFRDCSWLRTSLLRL